MNTRKLAHRTSKAVMKSHRLHIMKYSLPIRLRPWFLLFTCVIVVILAFLGFTNLSRALPINDKVLHFVCFVLVTAVFYFIFDVEEEARRIWSWRHFVTIFTIVACFFCGSILSEVIQSLLPYKEFDLDDIIANLLGSSVGLFAAYHIDRYYRYRREISRLYRPLDTGSLTDSEDDGDATQMLPTFDSRMTNGKRGQKPIRLADVWDEREELFGVGVDSDQEDLEIGITGSHGRQVADSDGRQVPKITVTNV
ncbi:hypothetical protein AX17_003967 [Amanita inopinata Kibby_2008]|nr:hypothetical protein AX17_003967 [Amanita inopinata Kibby_2008]